MFEFKKEMEGVSKQKGIDCECCGPENTDCRPPAPCGCPGEKCRG